MIDPVHRTSAAKSAPENPPVKLSAAKSRFSSLVFMKSLLKSFPMHPLWTWPKKCYSHYFLGTFSCCFVDGLGISGILGFRFFLTNSLVSPSHFCTPSSASNGATDKVEDTIGIDLGAAVGANFGASVGLEGGVEVGGVVTNCRGSNFGPNFCSWKIFKGVASSCNVSKMEGRKKLERKETYSCCRVRLPHPSSWSIKFQ